MSTLSIGLLAVIVIALLPSQTSACSASQSCDSQGFPGYCCSKFGYCGQGDTYCGANCVGGPCSGGVVTTAATTAATTAVTTAAVSTVSSGGSTTCSRSYSVVSGDTCGAIVTKTGVSEATIRSLNPSINSGCTNLQIGQSLCLAKTSSTSGGCTASYVVVSGDTCGAIASRYGITTATLLSLNPSVNAQCSNLAIGQTLCVGGSSSGAVVTSGAAATSGTVTSTTGSSSWPNGPLKAVYIDIGINWANPGQTFKDVADAGYNLIVLAFSVSGTARDAAQAWASVSDKAGVLSYIHGKGAKIIVSGGGATDTPYAQSSGATYGTNLANWAKNNQLDGVDFDLENFGGGFTGAGTTAQTIQWVIDATNTARNILGSAAIITHAPQPPYFGSNQGYNDAYGQIYKGAPSINFLMIQYYNNGPASTYASIFTSGNGASIQEIANRGIPLSKLVVGKPVQSDDAGSEWVSSSTLKSILAQAKSSLGWNAGVMFWQWHSKDVNAAWLQQIYS